MKKIEKSTKSENHEYPLTFQIRRYFAEDNFFFFKVDIRTLVDVFYEYLYYVRYRKHLETHSSVTKFDYHDYVY